MELTPVSGIEQFAWEALRWVDPLIHIAGFCVAVFGFLRGRSSGYLAIALYFAVAGFSLMPFSFVGRSLSPEHTTNLQEERSLHFDESEFLAGDPDAEWNQHIAVENTNVTLTPILLVGGLWLLARREGRKHRHQSGSDKQAQ